MIPSGWRDFDGAGFRYSLAVPPTFAYLHGFASSPRSVKGTAMRDALSRHGIELHLPDLNHPSFGELTVTGALEAVTAFVSRREGEGPVRFVGSSFGGLVAARWAELHPDRVDRLLLLCPGFDLPSRWTELYGDEEIVSWRERGWVEHPDAEGTPTRLHFGFYEDVFRHPMFPTPDCPVTIVHGRRDEVVPVATSRRYAEERAHVRLVEVDDDHSLHASLDLTVRLTRTFLAGSSS